MAAASLFWTAPGRGAQLTRWRAAWGTRGVVVLVSALLTAGALPVVLDARPAAAQSAARLEFVAAPSGDVSPDQDFATQPVVRALDDAGKPRSGVVVSLSLVAVSGSPQGTLACSPAGSSDSDGRVAFTGCRMTRGGLFQLVATAGQVVARSGEFLVTGPAWLAVTQSPSAGTAAVPFATQPSARVVDGRGRTLTQATQMAVTIDPGTGAPGADVTCTRTPVDTVQGVGTFAGCAVDKASLSPLPAGTSDYRLLLVEKVSRVVGRTAAFRVATGAPAGLAFTTQPVGGPRGGALVVQPRVAVVDAGGNTVPGVTDEIALQVDADRGRITCAPRRAVDGVASFDGCALDAVGTGFRLVATSSARSLRATSDSFDVVAGGPAAVTFTTQPSGGSGGSPFGRQPVVRVTDVAGNPVPALVRLTLQGGGGTLLCTATELVATQGTATFAGCRVDRDGTYRLVAGVGGLSATSEPFTVGGGQARAVTFVAAPVAGQGGLPLTPVTARVVDAGGNPASGAVTLTLAPGLGDPRARLACDGGTSRNAGVNGTVTFTGCQVDRAGSGYRLVASVPPDPQAVATSKAFDVAVGPPARLAFSVAPGGGTGGTAWAQQPTVTVLDAGGNTVVAGPGGTPSTIRLSVDERTGTGALTCTDTTQVVVRGVAAFTGCAIDRTASGYVLQARLSSPSSVAPVSSTPFPVTVGAASRLRFASAPARATDGVALSPQPVVEVVDAGGNRVASAGNVSLSLTPRTGVPGATLGCASAALSAGAAAFSGCRVDRAAGGWTLTAAAAGLTAESPSFAVVPATTVPLETATTPMPAAQTFGGRLYANNTAATAEGVNTALGSLRESVTDLVVAGVGLPLTLTRTYDSADVATGLFGVGWSSPLDLSVTLDASGNRAVVRGEDGQQVVHTRDKGSNFSAPAGARSTLSCSSKRCTVDRHDGVSWTTEDGRVTSLTGPAKRGLTFTWAQDRLTRIDVATTDRKKPTPVAVTTDASGRVTQLRTPTRVVGYRYTGTALTSVTDARGKTWSYDYAGSRLSRVLDPDGVARLVAQYGPDGRVVGRTTAGGPRRSTATFTWDGTRSVRTERITANGAPSTSVYTDTYRSNVLLRQDLPQSLTVRYAYDAQNNLVAVQDPTGWVQTMTWSPSGDLLSQSTPVASGAVATVRFAYDKDHRLTQQTDALGRSVRYKHAQGQLSEVEPVSTDPKDDPDKGDGKARTRLHYDGDGLLTRLRTPSGEQRYSYDLAGNRIGTLLLGRSGDDDEPKGKTLNGAGTRSRFDEAGNVLETTDARGTTRGDAAPFTTSRTYDAVGNLLTERAPGGRTTTSQYDGGGDLVSTTVSGAGTTTRTWDDATGTLTVAAPSGTTTQVYDAAGSLVRERTPAGGTTVRDYDALGRETRSVDAAGLVTRYSYDSAGDLIAMDDSTGTAVRQQFDSQHRLVRRVSAEGEQSTGYDLLGNVVASRDATGASLTRSYDRRGNVLAVTDQAGTTAYAYDDADRVVRRVDGRGGVTTYDYDDADRLVAETVDGARTTHGYDEAGNRVRTTDPAGRTTVTTLDGADREVLRRSTAAGAADVEVATAYDEAGRRSTMRDGSGTTTFAYDAKGNLTRKASPAGSFTYDWSRPGQVRGTYPDGSRVTYDVDDSGDLLKVTADAHDGFEAVQASYVRDRAGRATALATSNGVLQTRSFDALGRVLRQSLRHGGTVLAQDDYAYDAAGNRTSQVTTAAGRTVRQGYSYDASARLTGFARTSAAAPAPVVAAAPAGAVRAVRPPVDAAVVGTVPAVVATAPVTPVASPPASLGYDAVGNRLSASTPAGSTAYAVGSGDRLLTETGPAGRTTREYDASGALTRVVAPSATTTYRYDAAARLVGATVVRSGGSEKRLTYTYDGDGDRISRTVGGVTTRLVWDTVGALSQLALETTEDRKVLRRYVHGDGPVAVQLSRGTGGTRFLHLDPLGSTQQLTDGTGNVTAAFAYDAFGQVTRTGRDADAVSLLFQAQLLDTDTDLYAMRARQYDAGTGRFTQREPVATPVGVPLVSAYAFVANRPTVLTDPTGLTPTPATVFAGQSSSNANDVNNAKLGVTGGKVLLSVIGKVGGYSGAAAAKAAGSSASKAATGLKAGGVALSVIGIGLQSYVVAENCTHGSPEKCAASATGLAINVAFTVGCSFVSAGAATFACGVAGAIIGAGLEFVIAEFGPVIAVALVATTLLVGAVLESSALVAATAVVDVALQAGVAFVDAAGTVVSGLVDAGAAVESGYQAAVLTLTQAGYTAQQMGLVLGGAFELGALQTVVALTAAGYEIRGAALALASVFQLGAAQTARLLSDAVGVVATELTTALTGAYTLTVQQVAAVLVAVDVAVTEVTAALVSTYGLAAAAVGNVLTQVGYGIVAVGAALQDVLALGELASVTVLAGLNYGVVELAGALRTVYGALDTAAATVLKSAGYAAQQIAGALKSVYDDAAATTALVLKGVGFAAGEVATGLKVAYAAAALLTTQLLKDVGFAVELVGSALRDVYAQTAQATAALLRTVGYLSTQVGVALQKTFALAAAQAAATLAAVGFAATQVAQALQQVFSLATVLAVSTVLKNVGFAVSDIALAVSQTVVAGVTDAAAQVASAFATLGFTVVEIGGVLQSVFRQTAEVAAGVLRSVGVAFADVGRVLSSVYGQVGDAAASVLRSLGATATELADVLRSVFAFGDDALGGLLSALGFANDAISAIGGAFRDFGNAVGDFFSDLF